MIDQNTKAPLAVVTMAYNEIDFLPIWLKYYGGQVGARNCYIFDHGSDDGSTRDIHGANLIKLPRTAFNDQERAIFISDYCSGLLSFFESVIYVDCDEIIVPEPDLFSGLLDFASNDRTDIVTSFGLNLIHRFPEEKPLDLSQSILSQRRWGVAVSPMAKPALIRRPVRWTPGFHASDAPTQFSGLFNFHLARCDFDISLRRQQKRRASAPVGTPDTHHHKDDDNKLIRLLNNNAQMPTKSGITLDEGCTDYVNVVHKIRDQGIKNLFESNAWQIPERFLGSF